MRFTKGVVLAAALLISSPVFATTYLGGFEDYSGSQSDYDYNDLVFSLSGNGLTLHTGTGVWINAPGIATLNTQYGTATVPGTPFWNNPSLDGAGGYNVGSCVYGGGVCNGGTGLSPAAEYLATNSGGTVNDVYFSTNGSVTEAVTLDITAANDALGWELVSGAGGIHYFADGIQGPVSFNPGGDFILVGKNGITGSVYTSNAASTDGFSHMAFFAPTPEPSTMGLLGLSFIGAGLIYRRKK